MSATKTIGAIVALSVCASAATASPFLWNWERGDPGSYGLNDNGGAFESVSASFDPATNQLSWSVTFSDTITEGFTLALNNGPNPKGVAGELALLYVDASDASDVMITAYGYNGKNDNKSWMDGDGDTSGNQAPDVIMDATMRSAWVNSATRSDSAGKRTIAFTVDATDVVNHTPLYPDAVEPWYGIGFGDALGIWMHPYRTFDATYGEDGSITNLNTSGEGWFDGVNFTTVPTPGALALGAFAGVMGVRRKRA